LHQLFFRATRRCAAGLGGCGLIEALLGSFGTGLARVGGVLVAAADGSFGEGGFRLGAFRGLKPPQADFSSCRLQPIAGQQLRVHNRPAGRGCGGAESAGQTNHRQIRYDHV
jgi:hypothetical protein